MTLCHDFSNTPLAYLRQSPSGLLIFGVTRLLPHNALSSRYGQSAWYLLTTKHKCLWSVKIEESWALGTDFTRRYCLHCCLETNELGDHACCIFCIAPRTPGFVTFCINLNETLDPERKRDQASRWRVWSFVFSWGLSFIPGRQVRSTWSQRHVINNTGAVQESIYKPTSSSLSREISQKQTSLL